MFVWALLFSRPTVSPQHLFSSKSSDDFVSGYLILFGWRNSLISMISFFDWNIGKKKMSLIIKECFLIRYSDTLWWSEMCQALIKMLATLSLMVHVPLLQRWVPLSSHWSLCPHYWPLIGQSCLSPMWADANIYWCWVASKLQIRQFCQKFWNQGSLASSVKHMKRSNITVPGCER